MKDDDDAIDLGEIELAENDEENHPQEANESDEIPTARLKPNNSAGIAAQKALQQATNKAKLIPKQKKSRNQSNKSKLLGQANEEDGLSGKLIKGQAANRSATK